MLVFASKSLLDRNKNILKRVLQVIINLLVMSLLRGEKLLTKIMTLHVMSIMIYGCMNNVDKNMHECIITHLHVCFNMMFINGRAVFFVNGDIIFICKYLLSDTLTCMSGVPDRCGIFVGRY